MKNFTITFVTKIVRTLALLFVSISLLTLSSCKKEEENTFPAISYLRVINASPTLGTFDVYINSQKANAAAFPFGGATKYVQASSGECKLKFTIANDAQAVFTKTLNLSSNVAYSYFLIDKGVSLDGLLVTDIMPNIETEKAYIKFINLSPDAPTLSLNIKGGINVANGKSYKSTSEFISVDPKTMSFEVIETSTGIVKTTLLDEPINGSRYYTIIARGYLSPGNNDQAFSAQAIINQ